MASDVTKQEVQALIDAAFEDHRSEVGELSNRVYELEERLQDLRKGAEELRGAVVVLVEHAEGSGEDELPAAIDTYLDEAERLIRLAVQ